MKEIRNIILEYGKLAKAQRPAVLATLVHLEGSSYRRPGARMLVSDTGAITGAISGGCLEGDALQKALLVMSQQQSRIVTYDTMEDDDAFGVGLGCNGIIHVLMEPVRTDDRMNPAELLRKATAVRQKSVLVTLFRLADKKGDRRKQSSAVGRVMGGPSFASRCRAALCESWRQTGRGSKRGVR